LKLYNKEAAASLTHYFEIEGEMLIKLIPHSHRHRTHHLSPALQVHVPLWKYSWIRITLIAQDLLLVSKISSWAEMEIVSLCSH
jgi:hypothetical protein